MYSIELSETSCYQNMDIYKKAETNKKEFHIFVELKMWNSFLFVFAFLLKLRGKQPNLPHYGHLFDISFVISNFFICAS